MKKKKTQLLGIVLSAAMLATSVPAPVYAEPTDNVAEEENNGAVVAQEPTEDAAVEGQTEEATPATTENSDAVDEENKETSDETADQTADQTAQVPTFTFDLSGIKFDGANAAVVDNLVRDQEVKVDEADPTIAQLRKELEGVEIVGGEANGEPGISTADLYDGEAEATAEKQKLTEEQIQNVLYMFSQYQQQWQEHADVLGVQMPFYLSYNDDGEDGLGVLGEMLVLAGKSVDDVRNGDYSYDDVTGMILNFQYGDSYGIEYYGSKVKESRNAGLQAVKDSGATTEAQKLLALNDYLAKIDTFDMAYIMNSSDEKGEETMVAPTPTQNEHWDTMYNAMYSIYEKNIRETFENKIKDGLFAQATQQALRQSDACKDMTDEEFDAFLKTEDGQNAYNQYYPQVKANIEENGMDVPVKDADGNETTQHMTLDQIVSAQMDTAMDDLNGMTPNEAIPVYAKQAATQLTDGIVNYWEGTQFGAMALGKSVCLGYSKAYAYMIQCMHPEKYLKDGATDIETASNWKTTKDLYYAEDGKTLDINNDYVVDLVRITFDTDVTMYGTKNSGFNSDHFWNAVKVDGKWYYIDPCYTDVYTEVMSRDRGEINGAMNHMYFMFSHTSATKLYDGYYSQLKTLYADVATDKSYEDSWMSKIRSNTSFDGKGNAYYSYDSTNMIGMVSSDNPDYSSMMNAKYKIVQHDMSKGDTAGEDDFKTLIFVNYTEKESDKNSQASIDDYYAQVYNPSTDKLETNDELTTVVRQYLKQSAIYPSIFTSSAYYNGKVYFNISNDIYTYDLSSGKVVLVKEYNEVVGHRDLTEAFGAVAFSTSGTADEKYDITVNNAPIAGFVIKDGTMYVSIATNYAWVSGRTQHDVYESSADENGQYKMLADIKKTYGYEFQESNYNQSYSNYNTSFGNSDNNDNDEFMWTATITDAQDMNHLDAEEGSHSFKTVTVAPACGKDGYTEDRCETCGKIKEGSRKVQEGTAVDHHYVHYNETYYTKAKNSSTWNTGECYVCVDCGYAVQSDADTDGLNEDAKVIGARDTYELAKKKAGHLYTADNADDVTWSDDNTTATIKAGVALTCTDCASKRLDCLQSYEEEGKNVKTTAAADISLKSSVSHEGVCTSGITSTYTATGNQDQNKVQATKVVKKEAGQHAYDDVKFNWDAAAIKDEDGNITGYKTDQKEGTSVTVGEVKCSVCGEVQKNVSVSVVKDTDAYKAPTCEEAGKDVYVATVTSTDDNTVLAKETKEVAIAKLGHKYGDPVWSDWEEKDGKWTTTATFTCANDATHVQTPEVKIDSETVEKATYTKEGKVVYTASVTSPDGKKVVNPTTKEVVVEKERLAAVENLKASSSVGKVKLTWSEVKDAEGYLIYGIRGGGNKYGYIGMTSKTSFVDVKAFTSDYNYYWVFAYCKDENGKMYPGLTAHYVYGKAQKCAAVTDLKASSVKGGVKLTWTKSAGAEGYLVYGIHPGEKYGYIGMTTKGTTFTDKKASSTDWNFYWVFPYHTDSNGNKVVGGTPKYVYGKAK